jgi:nicotinamide mononucleotide transporter
MDLMEIFTLVTGVIYVILEIRQKNFMWVVGIATSLAAMWVFFNQGLYASFGLNTYYLVTSFIGLWHWKRDKQELSTAPEEAIHLNRLTLRTVAASALIAVAAVPALSALMGQMAALGLKENPMSYLDASVAVLSAVATWWLVKSYLAQWWLWIVADTMSVILCAMQGMWWMAVLYLAYVAGAVAGLLHWKRHGVLIKENNNVI